MDVDVSINDNNSSSDSDTDEIIATTVQAIKFYYDTYIYKEPCMDSHQTGSSWIMEILAANDKRCYNMFRMEKEVFQRLCFDLETKYGLQGTRRMSPKELLSMFLFVLGGGNSNRSVQERFQHSGETVSQKFGEVLDVVCRLAIDVIQPQDREFKDIPVELLHDKRYYPHFKGAIGAIDGTHVSAIIAPEDQVRFIGRKGIPTQNVMAVCNFDMQFIFVSAGWEGIAHDTRVFLHAINNPDLNFPHPPTDKYYLVDAGYPKKMGYLGPNKGERYHLPAFRSVGGPSGPEQIFNHAHSSLRSVIELTFGVWKKKWKILRDMPSYSYDKQVKIVVATMALHNYICRYGRRDKAFRKFSNPNIILEESEDDDSFNKDEMNETEINGTNNNIVDPMERTRIDITRSLMDAR